jgi:hypothetical protein
MHIGRESNEEADNLANIGSKCLPIPPEVFFEEIFERSIKIKSVTDPVLATHSGAQQSSTTPVVGTDEVVLGLPDSRRASRRSYPSAASHEALQSLHHNQWGALQA